MTTQTKDKLKNIPKLDILVFSPHPDDAEIFCGGTIASLSEKYSIGVIDLTLGELSSKGNPQIRAEETKNSSKILSLKFRGNAEIPDTCVFKDSPMPKNSQIDLISSYIRMAKPSVVLAPYGEERHPDHEGASLLVKEAVFQATLRIKNPELEAHNVSLLMLYMCRKSFKPSVVIDVTESYDTKNKAISAFHSQISRDNEKFETLVSHPLSISSIMARDAYYGSMIGVRYGEPFYIDGPLPLKDPMSFVNETGKITRFITP